MCYLQEYTKIHKIFNRENTHMYIYLTSGRSYTLKGAPYVIQHTYSIRQQEVLLWSLALLQQLWDGSDNLFPIWLHADEFHTLCSENTFSRQK